MLIYAWNNNLYIAPSVSCADNFFHDIFQSTCTRVGYCVEPETTTWRDS